MQKHELVSITSKLIVSKTVAPEGNEILLKEYIMSLFEKIEMKTKVLAKSKNRTNIIGEFGKGKKSLLIALHMDTVAAGDGWKTNPFSAVVKKGNIYGRGAIDDKGPFAVAYVAVKEFVKDYPEFDGTLYLIALADEETDNVYGVKHLLSTGFKADAGLIPDGGYFSRFDIGEKGCVQIKVESFGKQEHSALVENAQNALENLVVLISNIKQIRWPKTYNKKFSPTKVNFSIFSSGEYANTIPGYAKTQADIRFPLGIKSQDVIKKIDEVVKKTKGKFKTKIIYTTEPHLVTDAELIKTFANAAKEVGFKVKPITLAGNSVAKEFNEAGIPSIVHYPMEKITAHEPNEYINIKDMENTVKIYYEFLKQYFGVK